MKCATNNFLSVILIFTFVLLLFSTYSSNELKEMFFDPPATSTTPSATSTTPSATSTTPSATSTTPSVTSTSPSFKNSTCYKKEAKKGCYFNPTGKTKDECELRCLAGKNAWGKDACKPSNKKGIVHPCKEICSEINDTTIPPNREVFNDLLMVIPYNKKVKVYVDLNKIKNPPFKQIFLEYYLTYNKIDGVYYMPINMNNDNPNTTNSTNFISKLPFVIEIDNLLNDKEYTFVVIGKINDNNEYIKISEPVEAMCSKNNKSLNGCILLSRKDSKNVKLDKSYCSFTTEGP